MVVLTFPLPATERKTMPPKPVPPWSTNGAGSIHYMERNRRAGAWKRAAKDTAIEHDPPIYDLPPCFVRVTIPFWQNRKRDPSNYMGTCHKAIVDGLVEAGLWPDDDNRWVTGVEPVLTVMPKAEAAVTVEIAPRDEGFPW